MIDEPIIDLEYFNIEPYDLEDCRAEMILDLPDPSTLEYW